MWSWMYLRERHYHLRFNCSQISVAVWIFRMFICSYWRDYTWLSQDISSQSIWTLSVIYFKQHMCTSGDLHKEHFVSQTKKNTGYTGKCNSVAEHGTWHCLKTGTTMNTMLLSKNDLLIIYSCFVFQFTLYFMLLHIFHKIWSLGDRFRAI